MRNSLILFLALGSGFAAFIIYLNLVNSSQPRTSAGLMVVGAVKDIEIGTKIQKEDLDLFEAPVNVSPKILLADFQSVLGKVSRRNILKGEVIRTIDLLGEGENIASLIPEGYRAMTIPVTMPSSLSNMIEVGNRVDILLTYEQARGEFRSVTLVKNAKVIGASDNTAKGGGGFVPGAAGGSTYITLAVTPEGSETLAYAMKKGTLNIAIHSLSEAENMPEKFFTLSELFHKDDEKKEVVVQTPDEPVATDSIEIIRGLRKEKFRFYEDES